jgi:hypothetical protein
MAAKTMEFIAFQGRHTGRISRIGPIGRTYSRPLPIGVAASPYQIHQKKSGARLFADQSDQTDHKKPHILVL